ncbi:TraR/DksA family transcriptional regulator [Acinetobacter calcoaceticus]|uniref:TraR/DksA family transcriptional regulator n=1 Tax=Acinetobacter calcoaceticus TaxID=471 RepID=A0A4R1XJR2_ACICA|nr:TraR/DksA family transcriptional regulator [Acinetobacter calcoaceticus]
MADFADMATDIAEERLQRSISARAKFVAESNYECEDCGNDIPAQRRALGGVIRCIQCQTKFEAKQKHFR